MLSMTMDSQKIGTLPKESHYDNYDNLHPCSIVTLAFPEIPAALVAVQLMVPKSCADNNARLSVFVLSILNLVLVSSFIHV